MEHMNTVEKKKVSDKVSSFILKYRIALLALIAILVVGGVGSVVFVTVSESMARDAFTELDILEASLSSENEEETINSLVDFVSKNKSGPAAARANMLLADIYFSQSKWEEAKVAYESAAEANPKAYTAPLSYYNAAVVAEELNDNEAAISLYTMSIESENFTLTPRAYFNLGRIEDTAGNFEKAAEYYTRVFEQFPNDSWANLAKSRVLTLQAEGKVE